MLKCEEIKAAECETKRKLSSEEREVIDEAVAATIRELRKNGYLRRYDEVACSEISIRLHNYYRDPAADPAVKDALDAIKADPYFDIIPQYYQQKLTLDWIAEGYHCEFTTISRNKKRLCLKLYDLLR